MSEGLSDQYQKICSLVHDFFSTIKVMLHGAIRNDDF